MFRENVDRKFISIQLLIELILINLIHKSNQIKFINFLTRQLIHIKTNERKQQEKMIINLTIKLSSKFNNTQKKKTTQNPSLKRTKHETTNRNKSEKQKFDEPSKKKS